MAGPQDVPHQEPSTCGLLDSFMCKAPSGQPSVVKDTKWPSVKLSNVNWNINILVMSVYILLLKSQIKYFVWRHCIRCLVNNCMPNEQILDPSVNHEYLVIAK